MHTPPTPPTAAAPPRAGRREWIGLAIIALPCLVYAMDLTVLNLALPAISADLKPSTSQLLWMVDIYGFLVAGFLITMGTLGDRIGRRRLLLAGAAAFAVASAIAAHARSAEMLIAMRALLGVAGATLAPSTMSLIRNMFHDEGQRRLAIGVWISSYSPGGAIGPLVGGVMLQFFDWGSVFLLAVPVMGLLLVLGPFLLPEYRDPGAGRLDLVSVLQSLAAVLSTIYALKQLAEYGVSAQSVLVLLAGLALGVLFVRRQRRLPYPLLDLALFRNHAFTAAISAYALSSLAMFGVYIFITQHLQLVLGLSPLAAGFVTLPWALAFVVGSMLTPRLAARFAPANVLCGGLVAAALGYGVLVLVDTPHGLAAILASTTVMSLGMAPVFALGTEMIITAAPPERAGAASAISETSSEFSGALGIAVFGSLGMLLYRSTLGGSMPAGLPPDAADAARATLGSAVAAGQALGGAAGDALVAVARVAFVDALQVLAVIGAAITLVAGVVARRILGGVQFGGHAQPVAAPPAPVGDPP